MDDILRRLGSVEKSVGDLRSQVDVIAGATPHLATAAAISGLESKLTSKIDGIAAVIPHLATTAALYELKSDLIKWMIATVLATSGTVFTIAKFVH